MKDFFSLKIYTPDGILFSSSAKMISATNSLGEFGVLPGHTIFASDILEGDLKIVDDKDQEVFFNVGKGHISVESDEVTVALENGIKK